MVYRRYKCDILNIEISENSGVKNLVSKIINNQNSTSWNYYGKNIFIDTKWSDFINIAFQNSCLKYNII